MCFFCYFLGHSSYNGASNGFENESITGESFKYAERSATFEQVITSKYIKVSDCLQFFSCHFNEYKVICCKHVILIDLTPKWEIRRVRILIVHTVQAYN